MNKYHHNIVYNKFFMLISTGIVGMQIISLLNLWEGFKVNNGGDFIFMLLSIIFAYVLTDFINGGVHMYMDNNTNYTSFFGPFIAAFHMHHRCIKYKTRHPLMVYFIESGSKFWLFAYLGILIFLQYTISLSLFLHLFLVAFGIFSSFAEVSHYWCHNADKRHVIISALQKIRILLPKKHHQIHHMQDNMNYAFLNGVTDPILNIIARKLYKGYKKNSDLHALKYKGPQTGNR
ncbi:MAG TPA: hypothetical protein DIC42_05185 [Holosporales bacterium]|nr:hypothetical protein [Holosporales bacterium]